MSAAPQPPARRVVVSFDLWVVAAVAIALLVGFGLFAVAHDAGDMLTRVAIGVVLALALDGLVTNVRRRFGWSRGMAVGVVGFVLFALAAAVVLLLGPPAVSQAKDLASSLPKTVSDLYRLPVIGGWLERADAATKVDQWVQELPKTVSTDTVASTAERLVGGLVSVIIVVTTTFAVLLDGERLVNLSRAALPERYRPRADRAGRVFYQVVGRYFGGSLTVAVLMGLYVLTISLALGVPLAPLAAVWAMIADLIPQVGGFLGGAFLTVLALAAGPGTAVIALVLYVIYMNVENHFIQPAIVGRAVNLSPPTTMVAALIGGAAAGIPGALVATPFVGAVKELWFEHRDPDRQLETGGASLVAKLRTRLHRRHPPVDPQATASTPAAGD